MVLVTEMVERVACIILSIGGPGPCYVILLMIPVRFSDCCRIHYCCVVVIVHFRASIVAADAVSVVVVVDIVSCLYKSQIPFQSEAKAIITKRYSEAVLLTFIAKKADLSPP